MRYCFRHCRAPVKTTAPLYIRKICASPARGCFRMPQMPDLIWRLFPMKKRILSLFCALTLILNAIPAVSALEGEAVRAADTLYTLGLLKTVNYAVDDNANRITGIVFLVQLSGGTSGTQPAAAPFTDLPDWGADAAAYAFTQGWIPGPSGGMFDPYGPLKSADWFAMLLRMLGYRDSEGDFTPAAAAVFARRIGLAARLYPETMRRGDLYESVRDAMSFSYKDGSGTVLARMIQRGVCSQASANALGLTNRELSARQIADRYMSAVIRLDFYRSQETLQNKTPYTNASGFFITSDGIAVTSFHTLEEAAYGVATLITGEACMVDRLLWYDVNLDLAVIRVSNTTLAQQKVSAFAVLETAAADDIRPGDAVYALSNPLGLGLAVSSGVVSAVTMDADIYGFPCVMNTAGISQGSSGGAVVNVYGHVIAVAAGAFRLGNEMYVGIPAELIRAVDLTVAGETLQNASAKRAALSKADRDGG